MMLISMNYWEMWKYLIRNYPWSLKEFKKMKAHREKVLERL